MSISKAKWRAFRIASAKGRASPPPIENTWLITGPDTMPRIYSAKLHRLLSFHGLLREGMGQLFPEVTRDRWLNDRPLNRGMLTLKVLYHPSKLRALVDDSPFLSLIPKASAWA